MANLTGNAIDREGSINFNIGIAPFHCKLWYKIYGEWPATTTKPPTLILHGGPGFTSDYLLCMRSLASPPYAGTIIFFDQLGSGKSTHLPHTLNDHDFWTEKVFLDQIEAVISQLKISSSYCLFGQSWGAMLAASWASKRRSEGLKRLVLASGPVSSMAWCNAYKRYRNKMPDKERESLEQERSQRTWTEPSYLKAIEHFYRRHFMSLSAVPADLQKSYDAISDDPTVTLSWYDPFYIAGGRSVSLTCFYS